MGTVCSLGGTGGEMNRPVLAATLLSSQLPDFSPKLKKHRVNLSIYNSQNERVCFLDRILLLCYQTKINASRELRKHICFNVYPGFFVLALINSSSLNHFSLFAGN